MKSHLFFLAIFIRLLLNPKVSAQVGDNLEHEDLCKHPLPQGDVLSLSYYEKSCPTVEAIIHKKVNAWIEKDYTLAASLIRLHFHDCAVRGCDASILLKHEGSERGAPSSKSPRGFEVIEDIKAEVEKACPHSLLHRYSHHCSQRCHPQGAHTIGRSTCSSIQERLYNYKGTGKPDPTIHAGYFNFLKRKCRWVSEYVDLDGTTPKTLILHTIQTFKRKWDYYPQTNYSTLIRGLRLLSLHWLHNPGSSIGNLQCLVNLGKTQILTGSDEGEIRTNCNFVNH